MHCACHPGYHYLLSDLNGRTHGIESVPSHVSLARLAKGRPMFSSETLESYVIDDMRVIAAVAPHLIVGDMRQSLAVSAPLAKIPYASISNAYWSPYARQQFDVPELAATRILGLAIVRPIFRAIMPLAFRSHAGPLNKVRKAHGLAPIGASICDVYTHADYTLYADVPELVPTYGLPPNHHYIGPLLWSFPAPLPEWWDELPGDRPIVYVSFGSSGRPDLLPNVLDAIKDLDITIIAGTSERAPVANLPQNVFVAPFLPAQDVLRRASLFVSHGGSASSYVALAEGRPVLGIPSNMDQHLSIQYIQQAGAGRRLRSEQASAKRIRNDVTDLLSDATFARAAQRIASSFSNYEAGKRFGSVLDNILEMARSRDQTISR